MKMSNTRVLSGVHISAMPTCFILHHNIIMHNICMIYTILVSALAVVGALLSTLKIKLKGGILVVINHAKFRKNPFILF